MGLFPQSSKIEIHKVVRIRDEFKSISMPNAPRVGRVALSREKAIERIRILTPRLRVPDATKFKYSLGGAPPDTELAVRLLEVVRREPWLYESVFAYLSRSPALSRRVSSRALEVMKLHDIYPGIAASLLRAVAENLSRSEQPGLVRYCRSRLAGPRRTRSAELRGCMAAVLSRYGELTEGELRRMATGEKSWWVRSWIVAAISEAGIGRDGLTRLLNLAARDRVADVALLAGERVIRDAVPISRPLKGIHPACSVVLQRAGRISRQPARACEIALAIDRAFPGARVNVHWRRLLRPKTYGLLRQRFAVWRGYFQTDPTAWVAITDTIHDYFLDELYAHDISLGGYALGNIGSILPSPRLRARNPAFLAVASRIHELRLEADLAHPKTKTTGAPTRRIHYSELPKLRTLLVAGWKEYGAKW